MKKALLILLILFTYMALLFTALPEQLPDTRRIIDDIEAGPEGNYVLAENHKYESLIYTADYEGNIVNVWSKSRRRGQQKGSIRAIECAEDGRVYYLEIWERSGLKKMEIYRLKDNWDGEELVGELECPEELTVGSFSVKDGSLYLSLIDRYEGYIRAYSTTDDTDTLAMEQRFEKLQTDVDVVVNSSYDGELLYTLCSGGGISYYTPVSARSFEVRPDGEAFWMAGVPDGILYWGGEGGIRYLRGQEELKISELSGDHVADADITRNMEHMAVLACDADYTTMVYGNGGKSYRLDQNFRLSPLLVKRLLLRPALLLTGIYLFGVLLCAAAVFTVKRLRRVAVNVIVCMAAANVAFVAGLTVFLYQNTWSLMKNSRQISNTVFNYGVVGQLEQAVDMDTADWRHYAGSEQFEQMAQYLYSMRIQDDPEDNSSRVSFKPMLVFYDGEDAYVVNSWSSAYGRKLWNVLEKDVFEYMDYIRGDDSGSGYTALISEDSAQPVGYVITTGFTPDENIFMVSEASMHDLDSRCGRIWALSVRRACIYGSAVLLLMGIVLSVMLHPVKRIRSSMEKVAAGIYELPERKLPDNEFGAMWVYLHRMCKALKVQEYSRDNVLNYYYKFVPKGFERLFGKERLQEVEPGGSRTVQAAVCLLSLSGEERPDQRRSLAPGGCINEILRQLGDCAESQDGVLLMDSDNFRTVRAVFAGEAEGAVRAAVFGTESLRELESLRETGYGVRPCALLHMGELSCGLAGSGERLYPFAVSQELEILRPYVDLLKSLGITMAVTGEAAGVLSAAYTFRHIGYIQAPGKNKKFEIYEVLDTCKRQERERKQELSGSFAKGLELFYQNQFYKARGCFAGILKRCPEDYAARWYLFRCEALFEQQDKERTDHSLLRQDGGL